MTVLFFLTGPAVIFTAILGTKVAIVACALYLLFFVVLVVKKIYDDWAWTDPNTGLVIDRQGNVYPPLVAAYDLHQRYVREYHTRMLLDAYAREQALRDNQGFNYDSFIVNNGR